MNALATQSGSATIVQSDVGAEIGTELIRGVERGVKLALHVHNLEINQVRLEGITRRFAAMIEDAKNKSRGSAELAILYVQGCRHELEACYITVGGDQLDEEGRNRVSELVGQIIDDTVQGIRNAVPKVAPTVEPVAGRGGKLRSKS